MHALAVVLKHAAVYPEHEKLVGQLARSIGFTQVRALAPQTPRCTLRFRSFALSIVLFLRLALAPSVRGRTPGRRDAVMP